MCVSDVVALFVFGQSVILVNLYVVDIRGNPYKYGLGYEPGKPERRNAPSRL